MTRIDPASEHRHGLGLKITVAVLALALATITALFLITTGKLAGGSA